ncbi:MAG: glycosyltransferase family 4 protein [Gemmataceae bacterium]
MVDAVAPVSEYVARRDVERVFLPAHKVHPIPNGIDPARFPCPRRPAGRTPRVVFAGQRITEKGVDTLLDAAVRLRRDESAAAFELQIAGAGPLREHLEQAAAAARLTDTRFLGQVADVPALFASADVVVVPSRWAEAFGYVAIEAMACGAAVLVSDAGALPEVVRDVGVVFRTGDPSDLAAKLAGLLADPADRLVRGLAGRRLVETHYQLTTKVLRHFTLFMKVLPAGQLFAEETPAAVRSKVLGGK